LVRLQNVKKLAQIADETWTSKPSLLEKTRQELHPLPLETDKPDVHPKAAYVDKKPGVKSAIAGEKDIGGRPKGGTSENWRPEAWTPKSAPARG
jgi:hypothetical protein